MAAKTEGEVVTMTQKFGALELNARTYLAGTFLTDITAAFDQLTVGDDTPEQSIQMSALNNVIQAANGFYAAVKSACFTIHPTWGRLASSQDLSDPVTNLAALYDYLVAQTHEFKSRGLSKNAWAAGGSNTGTGTVLALNTDPQGEEADISHVGTLQFICKSDARTRGVTAGNEVFSCYASKAGDYAWEEGGAGVSGGAYGYSSYGRGVYEYGEGYDTIQTGDEVTAISAGNTGVNLISNGDFEQALNGTGTDKIPSFTITGTASHFSLTSTSGDLIKGTYSLDNATGGDVITQYLTAGGLPPKTPMALTVLYRVPNDGSSGTITGNLTIVLKDDNTTHQTLTIAVGSATLDAITRGSLTFIAPTAVTKNLRIEVTFPTYGGTSTDKRVYIDELILAPLKQLDGGRAVGIFAGATDFVYNDAFTASTTDAATGKMQKFCNLVFGRYMRHAGSADTWTDW
jgi:hypothetical protein